MESSHNKKVDSVSGVNFHTTRRKKSLWTNIATILFSADHALFEQHHAVVGAKHGLHGRSVYVIAAYLARSEIVIGDAVQRLRRETDAHAV